MGEWELRLLCLPHEVRSISIKVSSECVVIKKRKKRKKTQKTFMNHWNMVMDHTRNVLKWKSENDKVKVSISILELYDLNYCQIPEEEWTDFGVDRQSKWTKFELEQQT